MCRQGRRIERVEQGERILHCQQLVVEFLEAGVQKGRSGGGEGRFRVCRGEGGWREVL